MKRLCCVFILLATLLQLPLLTACRQQKFSSYSFEYFDTVTTVIGYGGSRAEFDKVSKRIFDALEEHHRLYNIYQSYDGLNNLCTLNSLVDGTHPTAKVDSRIIELLTFCKDIYYKTEGAVNVAMGSVLKLWHDCRAEAKNDPEAARIPSPTELSEAAQHTDIEDMIIDVEQSTVTLADPLMLIDVGAVAKGYAVEAAARALAADGTEGYVINVGGNVRIVGHSKKPLEVGIENPNGNETAPYYATLSLSDTSLVTSGSYQRYYKVGEQSYHHIIDSKTLMPAQGYISVSVVCPDSGMADALSTALFCMSIDKGKALLEKLGAQALWVSDTGELTYTAGFDALRSRAGT